jgi:hypothetical protein
VKKERDDDVRAEEGRGGGDTDIKLLTFEFWRVNSMGRALLA